jgi:hypothetical protein
MQVKQVLNHVELGTPHRLTGIVTEIGAQKVILVSVYGYDGRHVQTLDLLTQSLHKLTRLHMPIIMGGDFNIEAQELRPWLATQFPQLAIIDSGPTCFTPQAPGGTNIDYFIISRSLTARCLSTRTVDSTLKTHRPVELTLQSKGCGRQLTRYLYDKPGVERVFGPQLQTQGKQWEKPGS